MTRRLVNIMDQVIPAYIFDIDGTISDHSHRLPLIAADRPGGKDWAAFHAGCSLDPPIAAMCKLARDLILCPAPVIFITGRVESQRQITQEWLSRHLDYGIPEMFVGFPQWGAPSSSPPWLFMRPEGDFRAAPIVKEEILDRILNTCRPLQPGVAFEDDPAVCEMWRRRGLVVAKAGDYQKVNTAAPSEAWAHTTEPQPRTAALAGRIEMPSTDLPDNIVADILAAHEERR